MGWLFNWLYLFFLALTSPYWLSKAFLQPAQFKQRFLLGLNSGPNAPRIWVHAASVGEVQLALTLMQEWHKQTPNQRFVLTTQTTAGLELAQQKYWVDCQLAPLDLSFLIKKFWTTWQVQGLLLIEAELWPNLILEASRRGTVVLVNARLSTRHFPQYQRFSWLYANLLKRISYFFAADNTSAQRLQKLGVPQTKISCLGNIKWSVQTASFAKPTKTPHPTFLFVAGSIQPAEIEPLLVAYKKLERQQIHWVLVLRHPQKLKACLKILNNHPLDYQIIEQPEDTAFQAMRLNNVQGSLNIVAKIGVLRAWYNLSNCAFVGGSLCNRGGQNVLEAAAAGVPLCTGPFTQNFEQEVQTLKEQSAIQIVHDGQELAGFIDTMYQQPELAEKMGQCAQDFILQHATVLPQTVQQAIKVFTTPKPRLTKQPS